MPGLGRLVLLAVAACSGGGGEGGRGRAVAVGAVTVVVVVELVAEAAAAVVVVVAVEEIRTRMGTAKWDSLKRRNKHTVSHANTISDPIPPTLIILATPLPVPSLLHPARCDGTTSSPGSAGIRSVFPR